LLKKAHYGKLIYK